MEIYRVDKNSPEWQFNAYNYIRTDAFCVGQNIPVELEFNGDEGRENFNGILIVDDHKPVAGLRIAYPDAKTAKIERVCTIREKQKDGYGRVMIKAAEEWIAERGVSHIVISSQDRAQGFYEKCGYVYNPEVSPSVYDTHKKRPERPAGVTFKPDFVCVLVEKYLDRGQACSSNRAEKETENSSGEGDPDGVCSCLRDAGQHNDVLNKEGNGAESLRNGFATKCVWGKGRNTAADNTGAISFPIYQTSTFAHPAVGQSTGFDYSRLQNPTRAKLEETVAALEGGVDALAFSSGMAAITALMELFKLGDHIIADADLYGGSIRLFDHVCKKNGIEFTRATITGEDAEGLIKPETKAIFIETPTNPMMNVTDIAAVAKVAKKHSILTIVDNTFLSPYFQNPLALGADIVIHSGTKFLGGHNDTLAGFIVAGSKEISDKLRFLIKTVGSGLAPFDSWLILRGIKTLPLRMEKAQKNAGEIVKFLQGRKEVKKVFYPGIEGSAGYEICKKQARGFGSMLSFEVESDELAKHILKSTKLIPFAESLGGTETLLTYPVSQTHADVPEEIRLANGINGSLLRLSAGIEDSIDLVEDLREAFDSFAKGAAGE